MGGMTSPSPSDIPSASSITPPSLRPGPTIAAKSTEPPARVYSLVAAAQKLASSKVAGISSTNRSAAAGWQADGWEMYDLVGEQRFLANVLAGAAAQARFYVGTLNHTDPLADPEPTEDATLQSLLDNIGKTSAGRSQLIHREYLNLFVAGEGYLVGIPPELIPKADRDEAPVGTPANVAREVTNPTRTADVTLDQLVWRVLSVLELNGKAGGKEVTLRLAEGDVTAKADDLYVIRVWRSHPARAWEADSPTRSSLPVLRELVGLTMAISSMVDSRLAGAGIYLVPEKAINAMKAKMQIPADSEEDPFTDALIEAMLTPISDRASAAAYVPLIIGVPDGASADDFKHDTFDKPFDAELRPLREEAIRRLALGQDAPPELLLGVGSMNHWGAWIVKEDVIRAHVEPTLALICDAFTTQYLRPAALAAGYDQATVDDLVVWYDVTHMIVRPNRASDALEVYKLGELSGVALRRETGFDEGDAPDPDGDPALTRALEMVIANPSLASVPGIPILVEQLRAVMEGDAAALEPVPVAEPAPESETPTDGNLPDTDDAAAPELRQSPSLSAAANRRTDAVHLPPEVVEAEDEGEVDE